MSLKKDTSKKPFTLSNIHFLFTQKKILLNPDYQREAVWKLSQKQLLIDSIFHKIDIPKLYFRTISKDSYQYEVVDGQQRIRAIVEYINDGYKLSEESEPVDGKEIANLLYSKLSSDLQMEFNNQQLDIVIMNEAYTDDDIEEMFLRLQNGTPLNAAEKRRAIPGKMRDIVNELSKNKIFKLCSFKDKRYSFEDISAKVLHLTLNDDWTDIKPTSIKKTYEIYSNMNESDAIVKKVKTSFNFLASAFKGKSPKLKKYAVITLSRLAAHLLEKYNISKYEKEFGNAYLKFEIRRTKNEELPEDDQDSKLSNYSDSARADSPSDLKYRHDVLLEEILKEIPELEQKDPQRLFTEDQRRALFFIYKGKCNSCKRKCSDEDATADHIKPYSNGGKTTISNGQLLCRSCNSKKNDS